MEKPPFRIWRKYPATIGRVIESLRKLFARLRVGGKLILNSHDARNLRRIPSPVKTRIFIPKARVKINRATQKLS
jgi:hypothetical protein